jgi:hypothetical protein
MNRTTPVPPPLYRVLRLVGDLIVGVIAVAGIIGSVVLIGGIFLGSLGIIAIAGEVMWAACQHGYAPVVIGVIVLFVWGMIHAERQAKNNR